MTDITDLFVSLLFLPVTVFIIIPLVMLCGWLFLRVLMLLRLRRDMPKQKKQLGNGVTRTEGNR